jgi:hypothetical protein
MEENPKIIKKSVHGASSFFSRLTFVWIVPLFCKGWKKDLDYEDLDQADPADEVSIWSDKLER